MTGYAREGDIIDRGGVATLAYPVRKVLNGSTKCPLDSCAINGTHRRLRPEVESRNFEATIVPEDSVLCTWIMHPCDRILRRRSTCFFFLNTLSSD